MPRSAKLTVVLPGLIWPQQALHDLSHDLATPALSAILGKARLTRTPGSNTWLLAAFGLAALPPAAPLRLLGMGGDPGKQRWLCLDPVHLAFVERNLRLGDPQQLQLTDDEARRLAVSLAPTFEHLGEIVVSGAGQWHLRLHDTAPPLSPLADLPDFIGRRADQGLMLDPAWRSLLNEAQMLLHTHPVNLARDAKGQIQVNSLWPWGGGTLPAPGAPKHDAVVSDDPIVQGLAKHFGITSAKPPATWTDLPHVAPLQVLDTLTGPFRRGDGLAWRDALARLDADWFAPIMRSLRSGQLSHLTLLTPGESGGYRIELSRAALLAFWRGGKPLTCLSTP